MLANLQNNVFSLIAPLELVWGAIAGLFATIVMTLVEIPFWKKWGFQGVAEWQINWVIVSSMNNKWKKITKPKLAWTLGSHLLHGILAGIVFGILFPIFLFVRGLPKESALWIGLLYGMGLWFLFVYSSRVAFESTVKSNN